MDDIRLRSGISVTAALDALKALTMEAGNIASGAGGVAPDHHRDAYLRWVETAETQLRGLFVSHAVWLALYSDRYWHLRDLTAETPRPSPLVDMEARWQVERLEAAAERLRQARHIFKLPTDSVAVMPDTNVFAHYRRFDEINWPQLADAPAVRLVIPLLVLDELDELSYKSRSGGERAAGVLRVLRKLRADAPPETPVDVRRAVNLQLLMDPQGHVRLSNNDDEFLTRVEHVAAVVGDRVLVATGDYGMQLRTAVRGLRYLQLPGDLRLP